jgi:hypothetical protein
MWLVAMGVYEIIWICDSDRGEGRKARSAARLECTVSLSRRCPGAAAPREPDAVVLDCLCPSGGALTC